MKKLLTLALALMMALATTSVIATASAAEPVGKDDIKVGFIFLHDENSTYDLNFINAVKEVQTQLGLKDSQIVMEYNIPEGEECYTTAVNMAEGECDLIFADSFGHEEYMIRAAKEYPDVEFCHATGTRAHTEGVANFHNAFASIYEGRYLAGIAAGMKLNEMMAADSTIVPKMGYVGAWPFAEVISGYTSFYLGAKSVCPTVTMDVKFTNSWYDEDKEQEYANALIAGGCVLISQHADSMGAPTACENANVPNVSYNGSTINDCPNTFIVSSRINWAPYFEFIINSVIDGTAIPADWTGTIANGAVELTAVNTAVAAAGTQEAIDAAKAQFVAGELHVFDTANFTVNGATLTEYMADVDTDVAYTPDTNVIENGIFMESSKRSAPYFDINIDGITRLEDDANNNEGEGKKGCGGVDTAGSALFIAALALGAVALKKKNR